jgi:hypothetical protein
MNTMKTKAKKVLQHDVNKACISWAHCTFVRNCLKELPPRPTFLEIARYFIGIYQVSPQLGFPL